MLNITKVVIPLCEHSFEHLPATKITPQEMLPVIDKPVIQYAIEEAAAAGITDIIFLASRRIRTIEDHFDRQIEIEHGQRRGGSSALASEEAIFGQQLRYSTVRHDSSTFAGALHRVRPLTMDEPFAVLMPHLLIESSIPALSQMTAHFARHGKSLLGMMCTNRRMKAHHQSETKQVSAERCILTNDIFDSLANASRHAGHGSSGGGLLASAMHPSYVARVELDGVAHDCSSKLGYLQAVAGFALRHPMYGDEMATYIADLAATATAIGRVQTHSHTA